MTYLTRAVLFGSSLEPQLQSFWCNFSGFHRPGHHQSSCLSFSEIHPSSNHFSFSRWPQCPIQRQIGSVATCGPWFAWIENFPLHFAILTRQLRKHFSLFSLFSYMAAVSSEVSRLMSKTSRIGCPAGSNSCCWSSFCCRCCSTFDA